MSRLGCHTVDRLALGQAPVSFVRDIAPMLVKQCQGCHGPKKVKGGYRVDTFESLLKAGKSDAPAVVKGKPTESELFLRLTTDDEDDLMPRDGEPLSPKQIDLVKRWIVEGAKFDGTTETAELAGLLQPINHPPAPKTYPSAVPITAIEFGAKGERLFASGYREVTVWDAKTGKLLDRLGNIAERVYDLSISPDGQRLAVASGQPGRLGEVRIFDLANRELQSVPITTADVVFAVAFSNDGKRLAAGSADNKLRLVNIESGEVTHELGSHSDWVNSVAWNTDDSRLVTASRDKTKGVQRSNRRENCQLSWASKLCSRCIVPRKREGDFFDWRRPKNAPLENRGAKKSERLLIKPGHGNGHRPAWHRGVGRRGRPLRPRFQHQYQGRESQVGRAQGSRTLGDCVRRHTSGGKRCLRR